MPNSEVVVDAALHMISKRSPPRGYRFLTREEMLNLPGDPLLYPDLAAILRHSHEDPDAKRYHWLRWAYFSNVPEPVINDLVSTPKELDAAIDKAMILYPIPKEES